MIRDPRAVERGDQPADEGHLVPRTPHRATGVMTRCLALAEVDERRLRLLEEADADPRRELDRHGLGR